MTSAASAPRTSSSRTPSTAATGDLTQVFGTGSPEWNEGVANPQQAQTDFVGIAIHCAQAPSSVCDGNAQREAGPAPGRAGRLQRLQRALRDEVRRPGDHERPGVRQRHSGNPITDPRGFCGFPGFDGMFAKNTLGYVAAMQESGVPVTYGYISDAHDLHVPVLATDSYSSTATGPGELAHEQQLKAYDDAFASFFTNLKQHGITRQNTLFVITVDEGDHFAGGIGAPRRAATGRSTTTARAPTLDDAARRTRSARSTPTSRRSSRPAADLRHPPRRRADVLRQRPAGADRHGGAQARARRRRADVARPVRPQRHQPGADGAADATPRRPGRGEDPAHGQLRPEPDADVHDVRQPRLLLLDARTRAPASRRASCPASRGTTATCRTRSGTPGSASSGRASHHNGVDSTTWTDHTNLRPTILSLAGLKDDYTRGRPRARRGRCDRRHAERAPRRRREAADGRVRAGERVVRPVRALDAHGVDEGARVDRRHEVQLDRGLDHVASPGSGTRSSRRSARP